MQIPGSITILVNMPEQCRVHTVLDIPAPREDRCKAHRPQDFLKNVRFLFVDFDASATLENLIDVIEKFRDAPFWCKMMLLCMTKPRLRLQHLGLYGCPLLCRPTNTRS